jgi:hypothetical protein
MGSHVDDHGFGASFDSAHIVIDGARVYDGLIVSSNLRNLPINLSFL